MAYLCSPSRTKEVIERYNFPVRKKYGQNFLTDANIIRKILETADVSSDDFVLEIGPGIGTLTQALCEAAGRVAAVEIDPFLMPVLKDTLSEYGNVTVINRDILKTDIAKLIAEQSGGRAVKVVANLPYYITTPVLAALLELPEPADSVTVMVQAEVADRVCASPGTKAYGALSVTAQYHADVLIAADVSPECFYPKPTVGSSIVRLRRRDRIDVRPADEARMFKIVRASFNQRRKTLANALKNDAALDLDRDRILSAIRSMGLPDTVRGEELSPEQFALLSNLLADERA